MKRRLTKVVGSVVLTGTLLGAAHYTLAQDNPAQKNLAKEARREAKRVAREQRDYEKLLRWTQRHEAKTASRLTAERKFDTPYTARGSEVGFIDANGNYITLGYIDKTNEIRLYR